MLTFSCCVLHMRENNFRKRSRPDTLDIVQSSCVKTSEVNACAKTFLRGIRERSYNLKIYTSNHKKKKKTPNIKWCTYSYANFSKNFFWDSSGFLKNLVQGSTILQRQNQPMLGISKLHMLLWGYGFCTK